MPFTSSQRLSALARVSSLLRDARPPHQSMRAVLESMPELIPADAYAIWRYDGRERRWEIIASRGLSSPFVDHAIPERRDEGMLLEGPFGVEDVSVSPGIEHRRAFYEAEGIRSLFVIPLSIQQEAVGTLTCYYRQTHVVDEDARELGRVVADILSAALSARRFDRFAEATRATAAEHDLHRLVQHVTDAATELTNAQFGAFFYNVIDNRGESYMLYTISGVPREAFERFPMPRNTAVFDPTFSGTGTVRSTDIRKDPRYGQNPPYYGMPPGHLPVVSYLAVPVLSRSGSVIGGLFFGHAEPGIFTENEEQIAEALAAHAAVAIDNARLYDALQRERSRYRALATAAGVRQAIWVATPEGEIVEDLSAWREITGQTFEQLRGRGWMEALHPDDRQRADAAWRAAVEARQPMTQQFRLRVRDGSYRWFSSTAAPVLRDDGTIVEWVGATSDIHERKTAEDNLRFLAEATTLLASSLDYETTLSTVARLAVPEIADWCTVDIVDETGSYRRLAVAHVDPAKVELARDVRRRFPPRPDADVVARVIQSGRSEWAREIPRTLLDSIEMDPEYRAILHELGLMSYIVVPLRAHDRIVGALSFVLSDSQRRFTESDLAFAEELGRRAAVAIENAQLYAEAQAANRAKDEFLATLSHELRTPMTAVLGWARMLKMGVSPHELGEAVDAIERSANVQMQLIEDILDMSRIMAGKMRIDATPVDLCAVTQAALATVHPAASAKDIAIATSFPRHTPPVLGDERRLQQIVWNLLANAIKFTPRGGRVEVAIASSESVVTLTVSDTGVGIEPSFLPHVFERFRQQDSSTTRAHGGIGLGLAIVRHLVELHGGQIRAESEGPGRGATFVVELPAIEMLARTHPPGVTDELASLDGLTVLVIDDEPMTRQVLAAFLRRAGAETAAAESVAEAHAMLADVRPDVILCDVAMPGEDGYAFVRQLHAREPELARIPVIAVTAFGRPEDEEKTLASGFSAYLQKPVEPTVLADTVLAVR